jgi:trans-aconitate methyltransferase
MLEGDEQAVAIRGDVREPAEILAHREVRRMLDFEQPVGLLLAAVLHFVPDHQQGDAAVAALTAALAPGSALVVSHSATESFKFSSAQEDVYRQRTTTPGTLRSRSEIEGLFTGLELLAPGVVWAQEWRPDPDAPGHDATRPGGFWAAVGSKP